MPLAANAIRELAGVTPADLDATILASTEPLLLRGLVAHWPVGAAGRQSPQAALDYLRRWCGDATVNAMLGPPDIDGRFFYNAALDGFNFVDTGGAAGFRVGETIGVVSLALYPSVLGAVS